MKKMKYINIAKVLLLSCSLAILPACDDFLDEEPQSEVSPEKYLLNESQLEDIMLTMTTGKVILMIKGG